MRCLSHNDVTERGTLVQNFTTGMYCLVEFTLDCVKALLKEHQLSDHDEKRIKTGETVSTIWSKNKRNEAIVVNISGECMQSN